MRDSNSIGMNYVAKTIGFGYALNLMLTGLIQMATIAVLYQYIDKIQRKVGIFVTLSGCLICQVLFYLDSVNENKILATILMLLTRMFLDLGFVLLLCLEYESFPVQAQSTAVGIIGMLCLIGFLLGPLIVEFANDNEINAMGTLGLTSIPILLSILFIDEKSHHRKS